VNDEANDPNEIDPRPFEPKPRRRSFAQVNDLDANDLRRTSASAALAFDFALVVGAAPPDLPDAGSYAGN
jgi:hypothetical protein